MNTHTYFIHMNISKRLSRLDLKIYKVGHQERLAIDRDVVSTKKIISHKYNIYVKSRI
jgi:hypothetical protein